MNCKKCGAKMVRLTFMGECICGECTPCPRCEKNSANVDSQFGVLPCDECEAQMKQRIAEDGPIGRYRSMNKLLEHAATPYYLHMGLPLKQEEKAQMKEMKRRGMSWRDMQHERNKGGTFNPKPIIDKALKGELEGDKTVDYGKERVTSQAS